MKTFKSTSQSDLPALNMSFRWQSSAHQKCWSKNKFNKTSFAKKERKKRKETDAESTMFICPPDGLNASTEASVVMIPIALSVLLPVTCLPSEAGHNINVPSLSIKGCLEMNALAPTPNVRRSFHLSYKHQVLRNKLTICF